jgi:hypothetical protein
MKALLWSEGGFKTAQAINWKMVFPSLGLLVFGTLDVAFGLYHNVQAFILIRNPAAVFSNTSYWVNVMKMVDYVGQTFIGDGILVRSSLYLCLRYADECSFHSCTAASLCTTVTGSSSSSPDFYG